MNRLKFLLNPGDQLANDRVGVQQVVGQHQFRLVVHPLEQERQCRGIAIPKEGGDTT